MAARTTSLPRRDFLKSLGLTTGLGVTEAPTPGPAPTQTLPPSTPPPTVPTPPTGSAAPSPTETPSAAPTATTPTPTEEAPTEEPAEQSVDGVVEVAVKTVSAADRHLLSRFSYGVTQALIADAEGLGAAAWFEQQLEPDDVPDSYAASLRDWWPNLYWTPQEIAASDKSADGITGWQQQKDFACWSMVRRVYSKRQVHEVMTEFWSNLLHIPAPLAKALPHRLAYDGMIRDKALTSFSELLTAAVLHPAMLCYLDNAKSTYELVNENLGREVLELHTVGKEANFTEAEVLSSAMILTGWHVDINATWEASFNPEDHFPGDVSVLGFTGPNNDPAHYDLVAKKYLAYLAMRPATAARLARRLAVRFVSDSPSDALVDHLASVYLDSYTDIKTTLRALVAHEEFKAAQGSKVRTPTEDTVNSYRILEVGMDAPRLADGAAANSIIDNAGSMGQKPFDWPRPDGFPDANDAWSSASRALGSWKVHKNLSKGTRPSEAVTYKPESYWLLPTPVRFDTLVEHLSKRLLGQSANAQLQLTASKAVEVLPDEYVLATSELVLKRVPDLLVALLDTPQHMMR